VEHGDSSNEEELSSEKSLENLVLYKVESFSSSLEVVETANGAKSKVANPGDKHHDRQENDNFMESFFGVC
jgi:hypothetical protein